jgi:hypothetical protein
VKPKHRVEFKVRPNAENIAWAANILKRAHPHLKEHEIRDFIFEECTRHGLDEKQSVRALDLYDASKSAP